MKTIPLFAAGAVLAALTVSPLFLSSYAVSLLTQVLIFGLLAMSLDLLTGYTGLVSFNHASFFGVGAYAVGVLFSRGVNNFGIALATGILVPVLLAILLGPFILRSGGPYFLMITLAFGQMLFALAWKCRSLTGGDDGLSGIPRPDIGLPVSMWDGRNFYYLVLFFFLAGLVFLAFFLRSHTGRSLVGVRESESRMQALGYNTWGLKYLAYILAGGVAGLAGVLHCYFNGFISPQELNWSTSGLILLMVIIGGAGTLWGPVLGAGIIVTLQNLISAYTEHWPLFLGLIFIVCVMYAGNGAAGFLITLWNRGSKDESTGSNRPL